MGIVVVLCCSHEDLGVISFQESIDVFIGIRISRDFYKSWVSISYFKTYEVLELANLRLGSLPHIN